MSKGITMTTRYRVYEAREGCDPEFCGECDTLEDAVELAESEPGGVPKYQWATMRAAGGMADTSPDVDGQEDEEPMSWHGQEGWHCIVRVMYR